MRFLGELCVITGLSVARKVEGTVGFGGRAKVKFNRELGPSFSEELGGSRFKKKEKRTTAPKKKCEKKMEKKIKGGRRPE